MSQTPSHQRKVPVQILDDLSSKFLINLVSFAKFFCVYFVVLTSLLLPFSLCLCLAFSPQKKSLI